MIFDNDLTSLVAVGQRLPLWPSLIYNTCMTKGNIEKKKNKAFPILIKVCRSHSSEESRFYGSRKLPGRNIKHPERDREIVERYRISRFVTVLCIAL